MCKCQMPINIFNGVCGACLQPLDVDPRHEDGSLVVSPGVRKAMDRFYQKRCELLCKENESLRNALKSIIQKDKYGHWFVSIPQHERKMELVKLIETEACVARRLGENNNE